MSVTSHTGLDTAGSAAAAAVSVYGTSIQHKHYISKTWQLYITACIDGHTLC